MTRKRSEAHFRARGPDVDRFLLKVDRRSGDECWPWLGTPRDTGYGLFCRNHPHGTPVDQILAHRYSYEHFVGPIPDGLHIDHLCRNRICVNPSHLEPVTAAENKRRGQSFAAVNARKTHCPQGHPYDAHNTVIETGGRKCRICKAAGLRAYRRRVPS